MGRNDGAEVRHFPLPAAPDNAAAVVVSRADLTPAQPLKDAHGSSVRLGRKPLPSPSMASDRGSLDLLAEALGALEQQFGHLPELAAALETGPLREALMAASARMARQLPLPSSALRRPDAQAAAPGRAAGLRAWRCGSTPTTTRSTAGAPARRWRRRRSREIAADVRLGAGTWAISAAAARWPTSRRSGSARELGARQGGRRVGAGALHALAAVGGAGRALRGDRRRRAAAGWMSAALERELAGRRASARSSPRSARRPPARSIRCRRSWRCAQRHRLPRPRRRGLWRLLHAGRTISTRDARRAFDAIAEADSIVIDPHKHGLQPYGCGCVLFRDPAVGRFYQHDSPYTYFSSRRTAPGGDLAGVLARRARRRWRSGRRMRHAAAGARRRVRARAGELPRGGAGAARGARGDRSGSSPLLRAGAGHRGLGGARGIGD